MKFLGVIPARFGATRFPGKPLHVIAGKPLLQWVIEGVRTSRLVKDFAVATDDDRIAELAKACGVQAVMTDAALPSGTDRIHQAVQKLGSQADVLVNIQGDEPLVDGALVDQLAGVFEKDARVDMATLGHELSPADVGSLNSVKVIVNKESNAIYFSRFAIPYSRNDAKAIGGAAALKHIGLYAYKRHFLARFCAEPPALIEKAEGLEQLRALHMGAAIKVVPTTARLHGVDAPEDVDKVIELLKTRKGSP